MNEEFRRVKELFLAALDKGGPDERAAFLREACEADEALRAQVQTLLDRHEEAGGFLERPAVDSLPTKCQWRGEFLRQSEVDRTLAEAVGGRIGPYKLLHKLGEGGMGVVWVAEQEQPVKRWVALKVIKPGMDSAQVLRRFEAERHTLALMDHTNIAKVLDGGATEAGRPYFVMELVHGVPITAFCDEMRLSVRERLGLFVQVCQALQHAHQTGVIHRDVKPSNVLVCMQDGRPLPKVIDFGLAKALHRPPAEGSMNTEVGGVVGTPSYMAPEQAEVGPLGVDTRADVYALGVLLYELLTGDTPLDRERLRQAAYTEVVRLIKEEEPPRPSARLSGPQEALAGLAARRRTGPARLTKEVRGELDWIVMKALEKDRERRYETASALARDVERYLADEPVEACPPSAGYRLRKFVRRNKGPVLAAAGLLFLLLAGMAGTSWGLVRAERARAEAVRAQEAAQAREAETRAVLEFVETKVFAAARPRGQEGGLGRRVTLRQAVEAALPFVAGGFRDRPLIEARLRLTLGSSFWYLGEAQVAAEQEQAARALFARHLGPDHPDTLQSMHNLATSYFTLGRHAEALQLREEALALRKVKLGPDHPDTLASMNNLANSYFTLGRHAEALRLYEEALALMKAKLGPHHPDTLRSMHNLANCYAALGRRADALKLCEEARALMKARLGPDHPDTLTSMHNLANCYYALGRHAEALQLYEEALALRKEMLGPDHPGTLQGMNDLAVSYADLGRHADALKLCEETRALMKARLGPGHRDTLISMNNLANCYYALGRHAEALRLREQTLALRKAKLGPGHRDTLTSMADLANSYADLGRRTEALKLCEEARALMRARLDPDHPGTLRSMTSLANCYAVLGRHAEALQLREQTRALQTAKLGPDHPDTLQSMHNLATSYAALGRHAEALQLCEETRGLMKAKLGPHHPDTLRSMHGLANCYAALGRRTDALKLREQTLTLMKAWLGPGHRDTLTSMHNLALSYAGLGRHAEARKLYEEALALRKEMLGPDHPDTLRSMNDLANCYAALGRHAEALQLREQTRALMKAKLGPDHPDTLISINNLALSYTDLGRHAEAVKLYEEALALCKEMLGPDHPDTLASMNNLARSYQLLGRHAEALKLYKEVLALQKARLGPDHPNTILSLWGVAAGLEALGRGAEAVPLIDECVPRAAGRAVDPNLLPGVLDLRLRHFQKVKDAAGCRATAEMWEGLKRTDAASLYNAACFRAVTAAVVRAGDKSEEADAEAGRAMAWLRQAVAAGYKDADHMRKDKDLDTLRGRDDFQKLLAGLEAGQAKDNK
jgi:serine/threonine protein kinase/tetratricopeptide (TPR) repeat protein